MAGKTYLFQPEKKVMKQGYFMTDESEGIVYEAKMLKQPLLGAMEFEFVNHVSGKTEMHKVGKTLTTESGAGGIVSALSQKSRFKFDGTNIWDYLHDAGIRIETGLAGGKLGMRYEVTLKGQPMASLESTTPGGKSIITSKHYYNVTTEEENLDLAFLTAFAIARTDQAIYN